MAWVIQILVTIVAIFIGIAFHLRNAGGVTLDLYVWRFELPLSLVVVGALITGAALGVLAMTLRVFFLKREVRRLRRRAALAEPPAPAPVVLPVQHGP